MANIKWSAFTDGGEMQVGDQTVGLRAGDNRRFNFPGTGFKDSSGNYLVGWASVGATAVNYIQLNNSATGSAPFIIPAGANADITLLFKSKGNGDITLTPSGTGVINASTTLLLSTSTPTLALQAASKGYVDSVIPSYPITLALGGTSAALVASNGGIFYSTATAGAILSGTATASQVLLSGSSSAPSWSTATYPATTTVNQLLYSGSANAISGLTTANNGLLVTSNTGVPSILATSGVTGNMLRSNASAAPSWSTAMFADTYGVNEILYANSANSVSGLTTANNGVLITSAGGVPSISSTLPSAVQGNITQVGTITSGTWNGSIIGSVYGGTGVNNGASTITLGGSLTTSGAFASTFTMTGITGVTFPTSGTLATTSQIPAFPLSLANGGTNANLTAANGGIVYSNASALAILAPTATANQLLMSGSNTTPAWSTTTYPTTNAVNTILYASSANTMAALPTANRGFLITNTTGVPAITNTITAIEDQSTNTTAGTPTLLISNSTGITYPSSASFAVTLGKYTNVLADTTQTINSGTPGGNNFVYGDRTVLTYAGAGTNDLSRLFLTGNQIITTWTSANTGVQVLGIDSGAVYRGSDQGGRTTSSVTSGSFSVTIIPPASSTVTIATSNGVIGNVGMSSPTNTGITAAITTVNAVSAILSYSSAAASNVTTITSLSSFNSSIVSLSAAGAGSTLAITSLYGLRLQSPTIGANTTITNRYGVSSEDASAKNVFAGTINPSSTNGIVGTVTNDNANAGSVGEYVSSTIEIGSAISLTTAIVANITSISLTAGDWDVTGLAALNFTVGASDVRFTSGITSATLSGSIFTYSTPVAPELITTFGAPIITQRYSLSGTTTVYLIARGQFASGTGKAWGSISARRVR